ncbi:MAG: hypothetical protein ACYC5A_10505 [Thermoleophilia bacterium]
MAVADEPEAAVTIRPAGLGDKRQIFEWLARSDATESMMGPPLYHELPVTTWKEFCADYGDHYFDGSQPLSGRCIIIASGSTAPGRKRPGRAVSKRPSPALSRGSGSAVEAIDQG